MLRKVSIKKFCDLMFLFLMIVGVGCMFAGISTASACSEGICNPPDRCVWGICIIEDVWLDQGSCSGCQCPPCQCLREIGHCSVPIPGPGPDVYAACDCKTCANAGECAGNCVPPTSQCTQAYCDWCAAMNGTLDPDTCYCWTATPILIDVYGNGFDLTDVANGVNFDLDSNGIAERLSWTSPMSDDAFLVMDRNGNGTVDNGTELFGSSTPQPPSLVPNLVHSIS